MTPDVADAIRRTLDAAGVETFLDHPIGPLTTYRCGGNAAVFVEPVTVHDMQAVGNIISQLGVDALTIGNGSNMLVSSTGFDGVAIHLGEGFEGMEISSSSADTDTADAVEVFVGASASLPRVARWSVKQGCTGFEWAVGVPGTLGGAVRMNAGGHGSDMAASLVDATVLDLSTGQMGTWTAEDLAFGYRSSALKRRHCVLSAKLRLHRLDAATDDEAAELVRGEDLLSEIVTWRREHQPGGQNAGSVFTNPEGDSAGRLIDSTGCKGLRIGSAEVSTKHANFIQVDDSGNADDVFALMTKIRDHVHAETGIELHPETHLVGFDPSTLPPLTTDDPTPSAGSTPESESTPESTP